MRFFRKFIHFKSELIKAIGSIKEDCFIDIGANNGQFSKELTQYFRFKRHVLVEPIEDCCDVLRNIFPKSIICNTAVSNATGYANFQEYEFSEISSLLELKEDEACLQNVNKKMLVRQQVTLTTIDLLCHNLKIDSVDFLKIDVQGAEDLVLEGATKVLKQTSLVYIEASLVELYANSSTVQSIYTKMKLNGFKLIFIREGFLTQKEGIIQVNMLFKNVNVL